MAVLKQANTGGHTERELVETLLNYGGRGGACSNWRMTWRFVFSDVVLVSSGYCISVY